MDMFSYVLHIRTCAYTHAIGSVALENPNTTVIWAMASLTTIPLSPVAVWKAHSVPSPISFRGEDEEVQLCLLCQFFPQDRALRPRQAPWAPASPIVHYHSPPAPRRAGPPEKLAVALPLASGVGMKLAAPQLGHGSPEELCPNHSASVQQLPFPNSAILDFCPNNSSPSVKGTSLTPFHP